MFKGTKADKSSKKGSQATGTDAILSIPERWLPRGASDQDKEARKKKIEQINMCASFILEIRSELKRLQTKKYKEIISPERFNLSSPKESLDHLLGQQYCIEELLDLLPKGK